MISSNHFLAPELREKFLKFFESKGHKIIPSSSLVPENDPTVLFTTAGMQQFKRYYLYPDEAPSAKIATCQKCVRTGDIDEVGDETHLTFFEMLGNFSFGYPQKEGSYFKKEAIEMAWEFLTEVLNIDKTRIHATYFKDDAREVPEDEESLEILQKIEGLSDIRPQGFDDNFWSLGTEGSPGGPTVEFYVDDVEIWNLVFNEFVLKNGKYEPTELKGVDTGMGLERLTAVMQEKTDVYQTDVFTAIIEYLDEVLPLNYDIDKEYLRTIADHMKSACFIAAENVLPSNKNQGYVLRRLIRRALLYSQWHNQKNDWTDETVSRVVEIYPELSPATDKVKKTISDEIIKFQATLERGKNIIERLETLDAKSVFDLYQTYGFPPELSIEYAALKKIKISSEDLQSEIEKHRDLSRTASAGMFKGGLADNKVETTRLHTAAHLLLAALREVLGEQVEQKGSNITEERLRFDFNNPEKLTPEKIEKIEKIVNEKITEALPVVMQEMSLEEAKKSGATGSFSDRYGERVKVYTIGDPSTRSVARSGSTGKIFSVEICGGPHVANTSELGHFKITKEESSSSGIRRIKAVLG